MYYIYYGLRSRWDLYKFLARNRLYYILCFIFIFGGIVTSPFSGWMLLLSFISLVLFVYDYYKHINKERSFYFIPMKPISISKIELPDSYKNHCHYKSISFNGQSAIYSQTVNQILYKTKPEFKFEKKKFKLFPQSYECAPFIIMEKLRTGHYCFNETKIRLCSDLLPEKSGCLQQPLKLQLTDYFSGECTNEVAEMEIGSIPNYTPCLEGKKLWINGNILTELRSSKCANYIGISTLAITLDRHLVILLQSGGSAQSRWKWAPSGSGSVEYKDLKGVNEDFTELITKAMERELLEECGLLQNGSQNYIDSIAKTQIVGFARILNRGGKPEFFGVSILKKTISDLKSKISPREQPFIAGITERTVTLEKLDDFLNNLIKEEGPSRMSFPLYLNIRFLVDYIKKNPGEFQKMIDNCYDKN